MSSADRSSTFTSAASLSVRASGVVSVVVVVGLLVVGLLIGPYDGCGLPS